MANPALPPGFQLDQAPANAAVAPSSAVPALPPGFQIDGQAAGAVPAAPPVGGVQTPGAAGNNPMASRAPLVAAPTGYTPSAVPWIDPINAGASALVDQIPIIGHPLMQAANAGDAMINNALGFPKQTAQDRAVVNAGDQAQFPAAATAGALTGAIAPFAVGGAIPAIAKGLGMDASMPLVARMLASGGSQAAISGADALTRGQSLPDAGNAALNGMRFGALVPGAGAIVSKGAEAIGSKLSPLWKAMTNTDNAAQNVVAKAALADVTSGQPVMTAAQDASAAANGQPIINADRFGTNTQTLARTAANVDPTADAALKNLTQDRFLTQSSRAQDFIKRIAGGNVNDLSVQANLQTAAKAANRAAYDAAYSAPGAQAVWTPQIKQLFQSPDFIRAVQGAERTGANDAAVNGTKAVRNPFTFGANGAIGLRTLPDGSRALPSLQFWDIVQRNLRTSADQASRGGDNLLASQLSQMRTQLLSGLDSTVPEFQAARQGAAKAFGAEDALDAGRQFVQQKMAIPEAQAAFAKFSPAEQKLFGVGFASSLIDKIGAASDRVNVINNVFGSPAARSQVELALGKPAAAQLEQFTRIEDIMNGTKNAVQGNSSTAKQLIAAGVVGGGIGGAIGGWDPKNIASGAFLLSAGRAGMRVLGKSVDQKVMQRVAQILSSGDKEAINKEVLNATLSGEHANAIKAIEYGVNAMGRGATTDVLAAPAAAASGGS